MISTYIKTFVQRRELHHLQKQRGSSTHCPRFHGASGRMPLVEAVVSAPPPRPPMHHRAQNWWQGILAENLSLTRISCCYIAKPINRTVPLNINEKENKQATREQSNWDYAKKCDFSNRNKVNCSILRGISFPHSPPHKKHSYKISGTGFAQHYLRMPRVPRE